MSFYNVANPTQFYIYKQDQFGLVDQGKIVRIPSTQLFFSATRLKLKIFKSLFVFIID